MQEHMKFLGFRVVDAVTGYAGVITSISFDLYGCVQAIVTADLDKDGAPRDGRWFDLKRLTATSDAPVMEVPTFAVVPGGQELPAYQSQPSRDAKP